MEYELLQRCGLAPSEQVALLTLLEHDEITVGALSKICKLKRPTLYSALANLEALAVVERVTRRGVLHYRAASPTTIPAILREHAKSKYERVVNATEVLNGVFKQFVPTARHRVAGYEIRAIESRSAAEKFLVETLAPGHYSGLFDPQILYRGTWKKALQKMLDLQAVEKPPLREIIVEGRLTEEYTRAIRNPNHELKILKSPIPLLTDFSLVNGMAVLNNYAEGKEMILQIRHESFYQMLRLVFDCMWNSLPSVLP
jgi:predicted transcriptional regulator